MVPQFAFASGMSREYYPPSDSDYYQKKFSYQLYFSLGIVKVRMTQYKPDLPMEDINIQQVITWNVKENSYMWMDQKCSGGLAFEYLDESGEVIDSEIRAEDNQYLSQGSCTNPVAPSDFNEESNQYKSDTFGGKSAPLTKPENADGSGGGDSTGYEGEDDGTGTGSGSDSGDGDGSGGGSGSGSGECTGCEVLECPKWDEYMGKIDDIASKIPPPPNWDKVAETFRDKIAPQIKKDLEDTIGTAPDPGSPPNAPSAPGMPDDLDDGGIKAPTGNEAEGLEDSVFDEDDIKNGSKPIEEREDPTGGFEVNNPVDNLPSQEDFKNNLPSPEEGEAPNPPDKDNPTPEAPEEQENKAPSPEEQDNQAPSPEEQDNQAPSPEEQDNKAPSPEEQDNKAPSPEEQGNEAPLPEDDGFTAPIPNENGEAPIPGDTNNTAPIPGGG